MVEELKAPTKLKELKVSNPDCPVNDHTLRVTNKNTGKKMWVMPYVYARMDYAGGPFFNYIKQKYVKISDEESPNMDNYDPE